MLVIQLTRFLLPLVFTALVQAFGGQILNGGMARMPQATETLAGFGLAWGLVNLLASPLSQVRQLGLVLAESLSAFRRIQIFVIASGLLLAMVLASIALGPPGTWLIESLHGIGPPLNGIVREAIFWLIPFPLLRGLALYYSGLLMRVRRTDIVSLAICASIAASILAVLGLLPTGFIRSRPIQLPVIITYVGVLIELGIMSIAYRRYVRRWLAPGESPLTLLYVVRFFWPLALIMFIQAFSRPLINLFISREPNGAESLAVLTVVYSLAHMFYGWLNEIRNLPAAFHDRTSGLQPIRRFALACGLVAFSIMLVLFWTPLRVIILGRLIGIEASLVEQARAPLMIFTFFPLVVMVRAYLHGVGLNERRTGAMAPSALARIVAILTALALLPLVGVHGAARAIAALFAGFAMETVTVWWGIRGRAQKRKPGTPSIAGSAPSVTETSLG